MASFRDRRLLRGSQAHRPLACLHSLQAFPLLLWARAVLRPPLLDYRTLEVLDTLENLDRVGNLDTLDTVAILNTLENLDTLDKLGKRCDSHRYAAYLARGKYVG